VNRAYALLELKSVDDEQRIIEGLATTPTPDRGGDILEPAGAQYTLPIPLLWQHDQKQPIGEVIEARVTAAGIWIKAQIATITDAGKLKERVDEAWQSIKARPPLVRGLSVGWLPIDVVPIPKSFGMRALKWQWAELSAVTIPQNVEATILAVKSAADPARKDRGAMTTAERITALENSRAAKVGRMSALMNKATEDGVTVGGGPNADEYDGLELDVKNIDADLARLRTLETLNKQSAAPPPAAPGPPRYSSVIVKANVPPGTVFVRYMKALAACRGSRHEAIEFAQQWNDSTPEVALMLKAAVAAGTTTDATWAGPLAPFKPLMDEFIAYLRPATIVDRIRNFRNVPFNCSVPSQTGGGTYQWVGQGAPKPVGKLQFGATTLAITKLAGIVVITEELARNSTPAAEEVIRTDMINGIAQVQDIEFTDPTKAPVANVTPGSVTNGVTPITSAGTSPANGRTDIVALLAALAAAGLNVAEATLIMSQTNALALGASLNALGQSLFPGLDATGGNALGVPVIASQAASSNVIALHGPSILKADDGGVTVDVSREASVQMDSAPDNPALATTVYTSLWQSNLVGLRGERFINWKKVRAGSVQYTVQTYAG
jgi:HK97 family phage major capsid protein